jgi:hypothetical protein
MKWTRIITDLIDVRKKVIMFLYEKSEEKINCFIVIFLI